MNRHDSAAFERFAAHPTQEAARQDERPVAILAGAVAAVRRRLVPLGIWLLLCLAAAGWYLHVTPPSYTATGTIILDPKRSATIGSEAAAALPPPLLDSAQAESQIQVIRSERLLSTVFEALGLASTDELRPSPPGLKAKVVDALTALIGQSHDTAPNKGVQDAGAFGNFVGRVGARRIGQSYVVEVSYTSGDPSEARRLANAVVSAYLGQQVSFKLAAAQNGGEYLQGRVNALSSEVKVATSGMMAGTVPTALLPDADARVIGAALEPLGRSAPKSGLVISFAVTFGLLSGFFLVAVANGLDRRIRTPDQLERETGLTCLGTIPDVSRRRNFVKRSAAEMHRLAYSEPGGRFAAGIRDTRTSMLLALNDKRGHSVGVASWAQDAGRSLVAANLAQVIAMSGSYVTLVDADIHRGGGGLTGLVDPMPAGLAESLVQPDGSPVSPAVFFSETLQFVPARSKDGDYEYAAYLGSPRMHELTEGWLALGDVVVDLPPLAAAGDARAAAAYLDGIIVVVEAGRTTTDELARAVKMLSRAGAVIIGAVLNRAKA